MPAEMGGAREQLSALQAAVLEARSLRHDGPLASREFSDRKKSLDPKKNIWPHHVTPIPIRQHLRTHILGIRKLVRIENSQHDFVKFR